MGPCRHLLAGALLLAALPAQPLVLNTVLRAFVPVSGNPWVPDIKGFTDSLGRDFAIVCRGNTGVAVYEITNPAAPQLAAAIPATGSDLKDVDLVGHHAYCVQQSGDVLVIDVQNPYAAAVVATIPSSGHTGFYEPVQRLWIQCRNGASPYDARIYDVTNPAAPLFLASYPAQAPQTHDAYAQDGIMYVSLLFGTGAGTAVVDITNPSSPQFLHQIPSGDISHSSWMYNAPGGSKFLLTANETAGGHIKIWDVTSNSSAVLVSQFQTATGAGISVHNPQVEGRYAYISYYADYLRILDLANPAAPLEVGIYDPNPTNAGAAVFDGSWAVHFFRVLPNGDHRIVMTESFSSVKGFYVIDFTPPPAVDLVLSTSGAGDVTLGLSGLDPLGEAFTGVSLQTAGSLGTGPLFGLGADALFTIAVPLGTHPFHVTADSQGSYQFLAPPGSLSPGLVVDVRSVGRRQGAWLLTPLGRIAF
jgi:hypothetical protein